MPIYRILANSDCPPEDRHLLVFAFTQSLSHLGLIDRNDPVCDLVAGKVIEVWKRGVSNGTTIAEIVLRELGSPAS
jgi:hypothetical protein